MIFAGTFFAELLLLFLCSKMVTRKVSSLFYNATHSQTGTVYFMALLFFPGTVLHEIAHFLMAGILLVPVGQIDLWPKLEGQYVKLGSVMVAQTDIFRRFLIGAAPFLFGTAFLIGMLFFAVQNDLFRNQYFAILLGYAAFEIGNTMFSSKKDMEGALELFGVVLFFIIVFYLLGVRLPSFNPEYLFENPTVKEVFRQGSLFLLIPVGIDMAVLLILRLVTYFRMKK